jgi:nicotinamide mononucleotide transporter
MSELTPNLINNVLPKVIESLISITGLEWIAMLLSLAYVLLAARGSIWCWPAAFISTALYTYIFYEYLLLMDSALNTYYLIMAVYGYWAWRKNAKDELATTNTALSGNAKQEKTFIVVSWQMSWHLKACAILAVISTGWGYIMANYTPADFAYLDTFTTVYAVFATYLITQKVLENWIYWIVIDFVSIYLYVQKALYPTTLLFIIFVGVAFYGYAQWKKLLVNKQPNINNSADNEKGSSFA